MLCQRSKALNVEFQLGRKGERTRFPMHREGKGPCVRSPRRGQSARRGRPPVYRTPAPQDIRAGGHPNPLPTEPFCFSPANAETLGQNLPVDGSSLHAARRVQRRQGLKADLESMTPSEVSQKRERLRTALHVASKRTVAGGEGGWVTQVRELGYRFAGIKQVS